MFIVPRKGTTITHEIIGEFGAARVLLRPASEGTGVIAGGGVRAVLELGGVRDILAKSLGTTNPINMLKATVNGLQRLRTPEDVALARGLTVAQVLPIPKVKRQRSRPQRSRLPSLRLPKKRRRRREDAEDHAGPQPDRPDAEAPRHAARARPRQDRPLRRSARRALSSPVC